MNITWPKLQNTLAAIVLTSLRKSPRSRSFNCNFYRNKENVKFDTQQDKRDRKYLDFEQKRNKKLTLRNDVFCYKNLFDSGFGKRKWRSLVFAFCRCWRVIGVNTGIGHMGKSCTNSIAHNAKRFQMTPALWIAHQSLSSFCTKVKFCSQS